VPIIFDRVDVTAGGAIPGKILSNISCSFREGELTLITGAAGSGKSTLLRAAAGFVNPVQGEIRYGRPGGCKRDGDSRGLAFQYPEQQLFCQTVQGEFSFSLKPLRLPRNEVRERMTRALLEAGLPLETAGQSPLTLSGGEKRKVALGTVLAADPDWLLLDEPTAGLDAQGVRQLLVTLRRWQGRPRGGVIVVTHDLDAFFPAADRVIVLQEGRLAAIGTPHELCASPETLVRAGVGLPACVRAALSLAARGFPVAPALAAPAALAAAIARLCAAAPAAPAAPAPGGFAASAAASAAPAPGGFAASAAAPAAPAPGGFAASAAASAAPAPPAPRRGRWIRAAPQLDPRAKWLAYLLLSAGILLQRDVPGLMLAAALTFAAVAGTGFPPGGLVRMTRPFLWFTFLSAAVAGLAWTDAGQAPWYRMIRFDAAPAGRTLLSYARIWLVMVLGLLLTLTTSQMRMKQALKQTLGPLSRFGFPVEAVSMAVSLLLRFIPLIRRDADRFLLRVRAREGIRRSRSRKRHSVSLRGSLALLIPLLISALQTAEDMLLALEARGYRLQGQRRTEGERLRMQRKDGLLLTAAAAGFVLLWLIR
jgi:energy-coupling factor transport system ATP-binding protein